MLAIALLLSIVAVLLLQEYFYSRNAMEHLEYEVNLSSEEVFEGEDLYLYEILSNHKVLPLPSLRAESELPDGLSFRLKGKVDRKTNPKGKDRLLQSVESVFVLHGNEQIKRRWRITCLRRGVYHVGSVLLVGCDLLGLSPVSKRITVGQGKKSTLTVLPKPLDLESLFVSSAYLSGDRPASHALLSDPMMLAGTREYSPLDPMNKINWKSTAAHSRLMVNIEEYTRRQRFTLLLNMQSRPIELHPETPSDPEAIELAISVCATIIDRLSAAETPLRMLIGAPVPQDAARGETITVADSGSTAFLTAEHRGRQDSIALLRLLAAVPMEISAPAQQLWDYVLSNASSIADGGNLLIVSPYLDERMLVLHDAMSRMGYHVVFYITAGTQNTVIPDDVTVYFRTFHGGTVA